MTKSMTPRAKHRRTERHKRTVSKDRIRAAGFRLLSCPKWVNHQPTHVCYAAWRFFWMADREYSRAMAKLGWRSVGRWQTTINIQI